LLSEFVNDRSDQRWPCQGEDRARYGLQQINEIQSATLQRPFKWAKHSVVATGPECSGVVITQLSGLASDMRNPNTHVLLGARVDAKNSRQGKGWISNTEVNPWIAGQLTVGLRYLLLSADTLQA
jgi:hypothetical protein